MVPSYAEFLKSQQAFTSKVEFKNYQLAGVAEMEQRAGMVPKVVKPALHKFTVFLKV